MASALRCRWSTDLRIAVVGAGIIGACTALALARRGHAVRLIERGQPMQETSSASSKLLHGGLRYLETGHFGLVRKSLLARRAWLEQAPHLCHPLELMIPVYQGQGRPRWLLGAGVRLYDWLATGSGFPESRWIPASELKSIRPDLKQEGLLGAYAYHDAQMDDRALGEWVVRQATELGVELETNREIHRLEELDEFDRIVNACGPWAMNLRLQQPGTPAYRLDWVRGSHLIIDRLCPAALFLQVPDEKRIFFVLPYQEKTLIGTTEIRQDFPDNSGANEEEIDYLLKAINAYLLPSVNRAEVAGSFSGVRPLIKSNQNPSAASREWAFERVGKVTHIYGGKWTTAQIQAEESVKWIIQ